MLAGTICAVFLYFGLVHRFQPDHARWFYVAGLGAAIFFLLYFSGTFHHLEQILPRINLSKKHKIVSLNLEQF